MLVSINETFLDNFEVEEDSSGSLASPEEFIPVRAGSVSKNLAEVNSGFTNQINLLSVLIPNDDGHVIFVTGELVSESLVPLRGLVAFLVDGSFVFVRTDGNFYERIHLEEEELSLVAELSRNWSDDQSPAGQ